MNNDLPRYHFIEPHGWAAVLVLLIGFALCGPLTWIFYLIGISLPR